MQATGGDLGIALRVEELTTPEQWNGLRREWLDLWKRCPGATPFQSHAWQLAWLRQFGSGTPCIFAAREGPRLAGLLTCVHPRDGDQASLQLIGTGLSDYLGLLAEPGHEEYIARALLQHLQRGIWHGCACDFGAIHSQSALLKAADALNSGWVVAPQDVCPVLSLPANEDALAEVVPAHQLDNCRYYWRKARRAAEVRVERATPDRVATFLERWFALHGARWTERGSVGVLAHESVQEFHREAAPELLRQDALRLLLLRIGGQPAAAAYLLKQNGAYFYYLGGFDPQFRAFSPGTLLIDFAMREAICEGAQRFDFLRGREPYKYLWGAKDTFIYSLRRAANW